MGWGMRWHRATVLLLVLFPTLAAAGNKPKKPALPAVFDHARYVYVQAMDGTIFNPNLYPEDRQAISDVERAIQDWHRYTLTVERSPAELVFVVRRGRLASVKGRVGIGNIPVSPGAQIPGRQQPGTAIGAGGEVGPRDDLLWVCMVQPNGKLSSPLWSRKEPRGLESPDVPLFQQFKRAVDHAYPRTQSSQKKKP